VVGKGALNETGKKSKFFQNIIIFALVQGGVYLFYHLFIKNYLVFKQQAK